MCRYSWKHYNTHMVCTDCRVAMKNVPVCPHCRRDTTEMGLDFKAPPKRNVRAWAAVRAYVLRGMMFRSCGCHGCGYGKNPPRTANGVERRYPLAEVHCRVSLGARYHDPLVNPFWKSRWNTKRA